MKIRLSASGFDLTAELEKYTMRKVATLAKRIPRRSLAQAECQVYFDQTRRGGKRFNACTVSLWLDGSSLKAEESTLHMYTSLDIAIVHVERQLLDLVAKQRKHPIRTHLRRLIRDDWV